MTRMPMFSLKFCTAIEWPAPISTWPRCCSRAFIGPTKKPAHALQHRCLREVEVERLGRPVDQDELQRRARAPEQRRRRERNLSQLVAPEQRNAVPEFADQE